MGQFNIDNLLNKKMPLNIQLFSGTLSITNVYETRVDNANNSSYVHADLSITVGSSTYNNTGSAYFYLNASSSNNSYGTGNINFNISKGQTKTLWSGELGPFYHNSDGSLGNVSLNAYAYVVSNTQPTASAECGMSTIPRYASITSFSVSQRDETSVTFNWTADAYCDYGWYSTDSGATWHDLPGNNIISGLNAGTSYGFRLRLRRADSQLTTDSGVYWQQTYYYPHPTSINDFIIGNGAIVNLYNPLGRYCTLELISNNDGSVIGTYSGTYQGQVNGKFKTADAIDKQYKSIPNSQSGTYYAKVTYGSNVHTKGNATYYINTSECLPTFNSFSFEDINEKTLALTGNNKDCIKGYSTIKATVPISQKAVAKKYATITKYRLTIGSSTTDVLYSDSEDVSMQIEKAKSGIYTVHAIDSRGLSTPIELLANNVIDYKDIEKGSKITATRVNSSGEVVGTSELVKLFFEGSIWYNEDGSKGNFGIVTNSIKSAKYRYTIADKEQWSDFQNIEIVVNSDGTFSFNDFIKGDTVEQGFNIDNAYNIEVIVDDELSSAKYTVNLGSGTPHIAYARNGVSIMGKYNETNGGKFQIAGKNIDKILESANKYGGYILYSGQSNGTITLTDSAENYNRFVIYYISNDGWYSSVECYYPNNKNLCLFISTEGGGAFYIKQRIVNIVGNHIWTNGEHYSQAYIYSGGVGYSVENFISITGVVGYKY